MSLEEKLYKLHNAEFIGEFTLSRTSNNKYNLMIAGACGNYYYRKVVKKDQIEIIAQCTRTLVGHQKNDHVGRAICGTNLKLPMCPELWAVTE